MLLSNELSELTGLDFTIRSHEIDGMLIIDWDLESTLLSGLDSREQKEDFFFYDYDTMGWFMMDSLWRTLTGNLDVENIYYTMDGGKTLALDKMSPAVTIPSDTPYMGSEFYFDRDDVQGDKDMQAAYQGFWEYPDGKILEINDEAWKLYADDGVTLLAGGPMNYAEDAAWLMNEDGSSGSGRVYLDENNNLIDSGDVLTYRGLSIAE